MSKKRIIAPVEAFLSRADGGSKVEFAALVESHGLNAAQLLNGDEIAIDAAEHIAAARTRRTIAEKVVEINKAAADGKITQHDHALALRSLERDLQAVIVGPPMPGAPRLASESHGIPPQ